MFRQEVVIGTVAVEVEHFPHKRRLRANPKYPIEKSAHPVLLLFPALTRSARFIVAPLAPNFIKSKRTNEICHHRAITSAG